MVHNKRLRQITGHTNASKLPSNNSPLKVLFVDHTAKLSGGEIALLRLISALDRDAIHPSVLLFEEGPLAKRLRQLDIPLHIFPLSKQLRHTKKNELNIFSPSLLVNSISALRFTVQLARFLHQNSFDLVHTNSLKSDILAGLAARLARKPLLWHIHDRIESDYLPPSTVRFFRFLCRTLPHYIIANSQATLATLHLPSNKLHTVLYNGVERSWFEPPVPSEPFSHEDLPRIGLVGRISPWKGQHIFIKAAQALLDQGYDAEFYIIGSALFEEHEYEEKIRQLAPPIKDKVIFTGFQTNIKPLIEGLDILVHASIIPEPFGQVILEGMALGRAVIGTEGGGVKEIISDKINGLLVPMNDAEALKEAMIYLINHPEEARTMGIRARQTVQDHFTIEHMANRLVVFYHECLSK